MTDNEKQRLKTRIPNLIVASAVAGALLINVGVPLIIAPETIIHPYGQLPERAGLVIMTILVLTIMHKSARTFLESVWPEKRY